MGCPSWSWWPALLASVGPWESCYGKIALKLCSTAWENSLASEKGYPQRACPPTLVVLVALVVGFSPCHLDVIQFMVREMLGPSSCTEQEAFTLALQVTVSLMNVNCGIDPITYVFASTSYRKWLLCILKLRASFSFSPSSFSPSGKAFSETASSNKIRGSVCLADNEV